MLSEDRNEVNEMIEKWGVKARTSSMLAYRERNRSRVSRKGVDVLWKVGAARMLIVVLSKKGMGKRVSAKLSSLTNESPWI